MDISQILSELRMERDQLDQAIRSLERLMQTAGEVSPAGRPAIRLRSGRVSGASSSAVPQAGNAGD